jgi:hypothetical protein
LQNLLSALLIAFLLSGCAGETKKSESEAQPEIDQEAVNMITVRGTIRYKNLEGGFWALDGDDGNKYMTSGLDKALRIDGMVIEVKGVIEEDVVTFQQYGKTLKIKQSRMIDDSNAKVLNSY